MNALLLLITALQLLISVNKLPSSAFKEQVTQIANYAIQVAQDEIKKDSPNKVIEPVKDMNSTTVTLMNSYGVSYTFEDPLINRQRVNDLLDIGFEVVKGKLPEGFRDPQGIPPIILKPIK